MTENNAIPDSSHRWFLRVAIASAISLAVTTGVGTALGLATVSVVHSVYQRANPYLPVVTFVINALTLAIALWALSAALAASRQPPSTALRQLLGRNHLTLGVARLAVLISLIQIAIEFLFTNARALLRVRIGNATQIDFFSVPWSLFLGLILPVGLAVVLLALAPRWIASE